jgi:D-lactate dehydrogenase (cytochrome)
MIAMSLRSLPRASLARTTLHGARLCAGRLTQKRWASKKEKTGPEEKPFYYQLQESIFDRVQREKAEQLEIVARQQRTARGEFWATVTSVL